MHRFKTSLMKMEVTVIDWHEDGVGGGGGVRRQLAALGIHLSYRSWVSGKNNLYWRQRWGISNKRDGAG